MMMRKSNVMMPVTAYSIFMATAGVGFREVCAGDPLGALLFEDRVVDRIVADAFGVAMNICIVSRVVFVTVK